MKYLELHIEQLIGLLKKLYYNKNNYIIMFLNSIDKKPIFTKPDGTDIKDLTSSMFDLTSPNYVKYNIYKVSKDFAMRPDLISAAVYNNSIYAEIILKYNGISNPFSIKEGDLILIPNLDSVQTMISAQKGTNIDGAKLIRDTYKYIDPLKIPKVNTVFQNRQIVGGAEEGALPPNMAQEGETQITHRNGRVYFGESVATCLQNGMTSSEFITNVIKSKV